MFSTLLCLSLSAPALAAAVSESPFVSAVPLELEEGEDYQADYDYEYSDPTTVDSFTPGGHTNNINIPANPGGHNNNIPATAGGSDSLGPILYETEVYEALCLAGW